MFVLSLVRDLRALAANTSRWSVLSLVAACQLLRTLNEDVYVGGPFDYTYFLWTIGVGFWMGLALLAGAIGICRRSRGLAVGCMGMLSVGYWSFIHAGDWDPFDRDNLIQMLMRSARWWLIAVVLTVVVLAIVLRSRASSTSVRSLAALGCSWAPTLALARAATHVEHTARTGAIGPFTILGLPTAMLCIFALGTSVLISRRPEGWDWAKRLFGRWMLLHGVTVLAFYALHLTSLITRLPELMPAPTWPLIDHSIGPPLVPVMVMLAVGGWKLRRPPDNLVSVSAGEGALL